MCPDTVGTLMLTIRVTGRGKAELIKMAQNRTQLRAFVKKKNGKAFSACIRAGASRNGTLTDAAATPLNGV